MENEQIKHCLELVEPRIYGQRPYSQTISQSGSPSWCLHGSEAMSINKGRSKNEMSETDPIVIAYPWKIGITF